MIIQCGQNPELLNLVVYIELYVSTSVPSVLLVLFTALTLYHNAVLVVASSLVVIVDQSAPQRGQQQHTPQHGNLNYRTSTSQASFKCGRPATWRQQCATSYQGSSTHTSQVQSAATRRCYSSSLILSVCPSKHIHPLFCISI